MGMMKMKTNNKGFTLIELIVVIAIIAIVTTISSYSYSSVTIQRVKSFVNDCDTLLSQCRVETMSGAPSPTLTISKNSDSCTVSLRKNGTSVVEKNAPGSKNFRCTADINGRNTVELEYITLFFDRITGEMKVESYKIVGQPAANEGVCTKITISNAVGEKSIMLIPQTGYHEVM